MIDTLKNELKEHLAENNFKKLFETFASTISEHSAYFDTYIFILADYNKIDIDYINGVISITDQYALISAIRGRILNLINKLKDDDIGFSDNKKDFKVPRIDIPVQYLEALNLMTPELASSKFKKNKELMLSIKQAIDKASQYKEVNAGKAIRKMNVLKKSKNAEIRLWQKYIQKFALAFIPLNDAYKKNADVLDVLVKEYYHLCFYNVQQSFVEGSDTKDIKELLSVLDDLIDKIDSLVKLLNLKIIDEMATMEKFNFRRFGIIKIVQQSIQSKMKLSESYVSFLNEIKKLRSSILGLI